MIKTHQFNEYILYIALHTIQTASKLVKIVFSAPQKAQIPQKHTYISHERESVCNNIMNNYIIKPVPKRASSEGTPDKNGHFCTKYIICKNT